MMDDASKSKQDSILICPQCLTQYPLGTSVCAQDDTRLKHLVVDQEETLVGQTIDGRWVIERKIGLGGMGTVYLANQINIERRVAIKTMHRGLEKGHEFLERFLREANVASQVTHPHLVSIHDFGQTPEGDLFIVMEYLDGESLGERMGRARLTLEQVIHIAAQLCAALAAAHSAGIVHRDLKPDNIFLLHMPGDDIFIKLLDFGIAKHMNSRAMTQTGQVFGTPDYMSPEQCRGKSSIDHRSDLYALGCILYELISGTTPFASESMIQVLFRHVSDPVPQLISRTDDPTLVALEEVISTLLQKKPGRRYASALEVRDALEAALQQLAHPQLLMPAWYSVEDEAQSQLSTARLGGVTQEELESMMIRDLVDDSESELDSQAVAFIDTQDSLPPNSPMWSETTTLRPPHDRRLWGLVVVLCICLLSGLVWVYTFGPEARAGRDATDAQELAADMAADPDLRAGGEPSEPAELDGPTLELIASAISTARLVMFTGAYTTAKIEAGRAAAKLERKSPPIANPPGKDDALILVRTRASMERLINRASTRAKKCFNRQLSSHPERYTSLIGEKLVIEVFFEIAPSGEVISTKTRQVVGKTVRDADLFECIKKPYAALKFNARSEIDGVETQGAELTFQLRRD